MRRKNLFKYLVMALGIVGVIAYGADKPVKIVAAHNQTDQTNPYQTGMLKFKEVAEKESNNTLSVEVYAGTLGTDEKELVNKLKLRSADVIITSPGFLTNTGIKEADLFALPYLFDSYEHWEKALDGEPGKMMAEIINKKSKNDFKLIGYYTAGVRHYYGKKPLQSIEDLKGMTIRTQTSGLIADFWKQAGAVPVDVAWGELYQALQQDVIDSAENAYPYFVQQNHHMTKNGKYTTETGHDYTTRMLLINGKKFDSLSEEQQNAILKAAAASVEQERKDLYAQEGEYLEKFKGDGGEVNQIDRKPLQDIAIPLQDEGAAKLGPDAVKLLDMIRSN